MPKDTYILSLAKQSWLHYRGYAFTRIDHNSTFSYWPAIQATMVWVWQSQAKLSYYYSLETGKYMHIYKHIHTQIHTHTHILKRATDREKFQIRCFCLVFVAPAQKVRVMVAQKDKNRHPWGLNIFQKKCHSRYTWYNRILWCSFIVEKFSQGMKKREGFISSKR